MSELFVDIETIGTEGWDGVENLLVLGYALDDDPVTTLSWFDFNLFEESVLDTDHIRNLLADPALPIAEHTKYDVRWLAQAGFEVAGDILDTAAMAWTLNENTPLDLDWLAWRYSEVEMDKRLKHHNGGMAFLCDDGTLVPLEDFPGLPYDCDAWQQMLAYNVRDVDAQRELFSDLLVRLEESEWEPYWREQVVPLTGVLHRMELRGLPINLEEVAEFAGDLEVENAAEAASLLEKGGLPPSFNLNSQKQMVDYLFSRQVRLVDALVYDTETVQCIKSCIDGEHEDCEDDTVDPDQMMGGVRHCIDFLPDGFVFEKLGRDRVHGYWSFKGRGLARTPHNVNKVTGEEAKLPSVSSPHLLYKHGKDPWVHELCTGYRKHEKLLTTYLRVYPKVAREGRVYTRFNQTGTVTGRLSSSGPNLQNQPARGDLGKRTRHLFQGNFIIGDYDQLEMRIMAHDSEDPRMLKVFRDGEDPHMLTAQAIFGQDATKDERDIGKQLNYAMGYGAMGKRVAMQLSLFGYPTDVDTAKGYLAELMRFYRVFFKYKDTLVAKAKKTGNVRTIGGRRRRLRGAFKDVSNWKAVGYGERQAVNSRIQGSAADIINDAMVEAEVEFPDLPMLAQVHDEVIFEYRTVPHQSELDRLRKVFEVGHGFDLLVPLVFEPHICETWADKSTGGIDLGEWDDDDEA